MSLSRGGRLGPYEIVGMLGAGGMGVVVYCARDPRLGREVAIKILPEELASDPRRLERFDHEARAVATLNHPNILSVHDVGNERGTPYVVFELLDGETLRERLGRGPLPTAEAVDLALQAARGLAAAHREGIVHRDVKPENLFLTRGRLLKILDFGLAKALSVENGGGATAETASALTEPGGRVGTAAYMSPEQARGQSVGHRSDLFSLGVVLHEMLAGASPFRRDTAAETVVAILKEPPAVLPAAVTQQAPGLGPILERCLEKDPDSRFQSAADLEFALQLALGPVAPVGTPHVGGTRVRHAGELAILSESGFSAMSGPLLRVPAQGAGAHRVDEAREAGVGHGRSATHARRSRASRRPQAFSPAAAPAARRPWEAVAAPFLRAAARAAPGRTRTRRIGSPLALGAPSAAGGEATRRKK